MRLNILILFLILSFTIAKPGGKPLPICAFFNEGSELSESTTSWCKEGILAAVEDINSNDTLNLDINLHSHDCENWEGKCLSEVEQAIKHDNPWIIMGAGSGELSKFVQFYCMSYNMNQIDYGSTASVLSDVFKYTNLARVSVTDRYLTDALFDLILKIGWKFITIIAENSDYGTSSSEMFIHTSEKKETDLEITASYLIEPHVSLPLTEDSLERVTRILQKIKEGESRVIILFSHSSVAQAILYKANELGLVGKGWTWISTKWGVVDTWKMSDEKYSETIKQSMEGVIGVSATKGNEKLLYEKMKNYVDIHHEIVDGLKAKCDLDELVIDTQEMTPMTFYAYDTIQVIADAFLINNDNKTFFDSLKDREFQGITGSIRFDRSFDRITTTVDVINMRDGKLHIVGKWTPDIMNGTVYKGSGTFEETDKIYYADKTTNIPSDRFIEEESATAEFFTIVTLLLVISLACGAVIEEYDIHRFPETAAVVILGIITGLIIRYGFGKSLQRTAIFDEEFFSLILLPIIIFESGFGMKNKEFFFKHIGTILVYAVIGAFMTAMLVGSMLLIPFNNNWFSFKWSIFEDFSYGSLISATDPVSTLAIFGSLKVEPMLNMLIFGESVVNDAVSIVLFKTFTGFMVTDITKSAILWAIAKFFIMFIGSTIIGIVLAILCSLVLRVSPIHHPVLESAIIFLVSYMSFEVCEALTLSGITSSVFCGIAMNYTARKRMSPKGKEFSYTMFRMLAQISETFIFFQIGLNVFLYMDFKDIPFGLTFWLLFEIVIIRIFMVTFLTFFVNLFRKSNKIPYNYQVIQIYAGLRGAIAYSLSVSFPSHNRPTIVAATMWIILLTLFIQGCSTYDMLKWMKIPLGVEYVKPPEMKQEHDISELLEAYTPNSLKRLFSKSSRGLNSSKRKANEEYLLAEDMEDDEIVYE